jgi:hypothetical protein
MKYRLLLILLAGCLLLTACARSTQQNLPASTALPDNTADVARFPTATVTIMPTPVPTSGDTHYELDGISFVVPACMALRPTVETVPAVLPDPNAGPLMYFPAHRQVTFEGYPLHGKYFEPLLRVFPVTEFESMSDMSADRITRMREVLEDQTITPKNTLPLLPGYNAAQVFHAQVKFLDFRNGLGIRWLTELAQYSAPVNNRDLFYSYQGMTSDGEYWVSVMLPVNAAYLQETWDSAEVPPGGLVQPAPASPQMAEKLKEYYRLMVLMLENTPDAAFTPALDCLDKMVASITITQ